MQLKIPGQGEEQEKKKKKAQLAGAFSPKNNCTLKGPWNTDNTRAN